MINFITSITNLDLSNHTKLISIHGREVEKGRREIGPISGAKPVKLKMKFITNRFIHKTTKEREIYVMLPFLFFYCALASSLAFAVLSLSLFLQRVFALNSRPIDLHY